MKEKEKKLEKCAKRIYYILYIILCCKLIIANLGY